MKALNGFHSFKCRVQIVDLIGPGAVAKFQALVHQAFFIMALRVRDGSGLIHALVLVARPAEIGRVAHCRFVVIVGGVCPDHETVLDQRLLLGKFGPVLEDHVKIWIVLPDLIRIFIQKVDAVLIIRIPIPWCLCHSLREIQSVSIHMEFFYPMPKNSLHVLLRCWTVVVPIKEPSLRIGSDSIEPRVVFSGLKVVRIPVQLQKGVREIRVIENNVQ